MKPLGSISNKAKSWYIWGDKLSKKFRIYYNKAARGFLKREIIKENYE